MSNFPAKERALGMYREMYKIRMYEESIYYLFLEPKLEHREENHDHSDADC